MRKNEVSVTNNDDNLVSGFYESACSGDIVCDIFDNEEYIVTENSVVRVNNNKSIWQGKVIKITFSSLPQDSNNLKSDMD